MLAEMAAHRALLRPDADSLMILAAWWDWLSACYSASTAQGYWGWAFRFLRHNPTPLVYVTEQQVAQWLETYPYRSQSRRDGHLALKSLFNWMESHRLIVVNPISAIRVVAPPEKEVRALTDSEFRAVYAAAWKRAPYRAHAIALLYYTGGRLNEVTHLLWEDVKSDHLMLRVTKGGKERKIPMTPMLYEALNGLAERFGHEERVLPRSGQTVWLWCRQAGDDAGVEHVHPHLFRATAISDMLEAGAPIHDAAKFAGHRSIKVTHKHYAATNDEKVRRAAEKLRRIGPPLEDA